MLFVRADARRRGRALSRRSVFRLIKRARSLRVLFYTFVVALPSVANVAALVFLVIFVYAVVCMNLLGLVAYGTSPWSALSAHGNFGTFFNSFLTLVRWRRGGRARCAVCVRVPLGICLFVRMCVSQSSACLCACMASKLRAVSRPQLCLFRSRARVRSAARVIPAARCSSV